MNTRSEFAGRLRQRILIERPVQQRSPTGLRVEQWETVTQCLAAIEAIGAAGTEEGMALAAMGRFRVLIRWRADVEVGQRLEWRGGRMIVRQVKFDPRLPDRIELRCEELRQ